MANLERLFRRYQRRQDVGALARVFDETAPEVLRVALHFSGDLSSAEELLQETFVTAIQRADRYDPTQRLVPWLLGILGNHARNARRKAARVPDGDRLPLRAIQPVDASLDDAESSDALKNTIDALSEPYREVLVLHLEHGLSATAIAHALDRAPATVRSQLHRGLEKLRERLPANTWKHALGSAPLAVGLASVRMAVLAEAKTAAAITQTAAATTAATVFVLGGWTVSKNLLMGGAVTLALALVGGAALLTRNDAAESTDERTPDLITQADTDNVPPATPTLLGASDAGTRAAQATEPVTPAPKKRGPVPLDAPIPEGKGSVAGTLEFDDGEPVVGVRVSLWGSTEIEAVTDEEGAFHLHGDWVANRGIYIRGPKKFDALMLDEVVMKANERVFVEVVVQRGHAYEGTLVSADDGKPLPDTYVILRRPENEGQARYATDHSDDAGHFRIDHLPAGRYSIEIKRPGFLTHMKLLEIEPGMRPVDIELERSRPLRIRFEGISPEVKGTKISWSFQAIREDGAHFSPDGKSVVDENGEIVVDAPPPGKYVLTLFSSKYTPRIERNPFVVEYGDLEPLALTVPARRRVEGRLTTMHGQPLPNLPLRIGNAKAKSDREGRFAFANAPEGRQFVWTQIGGASVRVGTVVVEPKPLTDVNLAMPGDAILRALFRWQGNASGHAILLGTEDHQAVAASPVKSGEAIEFPHLLPGRFQFVLSVHGYKGGTRTVELHGGQVTDLGDTTLAVEVQIGIDVAVPDGSTLPQTIGLEQLNGPSEAASPAVFLMNPNRGMLTGLQPGTYDFIFTAQGFHDIEKTVVVKATKNKKLRLVFEPR